MVKLNEKILRNKFIIPATFKKIIEEIARVIEKPIGELVREGALDYGALLTTNVAETIAKNEINGIDSEQQQILAKLFQRRLNFGLKKSLIEILMETPNILFRRQK